MSPPWWWHGSRYDYYNYYYGYGNRRADAAEASLSAERKNREAENQMRERMQNKVDEQRAAQDKILQQQIRQAQETSAESIRNLERDRKEIIAKFESSAAATAKANSAEKAEIMNAHNNTIREKDAAIAKERKDQEEKVEKLRKEHEETRAKYEAKVAEEMDKRREDEKEHGKQMGELHEKRFEDMRVASEKFLALERDKTNIAMQGMMIHGQNIANSFLSLQNVTTINAIQGASDNLKTKIEAMLSEINRMEMRRGQLLDWTVEAKISSAPVPDYQAKVILDSLKEDLNNLKGLFKNCVSDLSANSTFARDRVEAAKGILHAAITITRPFYDAIAAVRVATVTEPKSVSLADIDQCMQQLRNLIQSFPSMSDQTTHECLQLEMAKLTIQNQDTLATLSNNAIAFGVSSRPAIQNGPVIPFNSPINHFSGQPFDYASQSRGNFDAPGTCLIQFDPNCLIYSAFDLLCVQMLNKLDALVSERLEERKGRGRSTSNRADVHQNRTTDFEEMEKQMLERMMKEEEMKFQEKMKSLSLFEEELKGADRSSKEAKQKLDDTLLESAARESLDRDNRNKKLKEQNERNRMEYELKKREYEKSEETHNQRWNSRNMEQSKNYDEMLYAKEEEIRKGEVENEALNRQAAKELDRMNEQLQFEQEQAHKAFREHLNSCRSQFRDFVMLMMKKQWNRQMEDKWAERLNGLKKWFNPIRQQFFLLRMRIEDLSSQFGLPDFSAADRAKMGINVSMLVNELETIINVMENEILDMQRMSEERPQATFLYDIQKSAREIANSASELSSNLQIMVAEDKMQLALWDQCVKCYDYLENSVEGIPTVNGLKRKYQAGV
ncbi:hypothetical protein PRIPAC_88459 [Pristionchus pacificus]|uniref:Uncharacterized protein n=1 Tax=Pristionchus pacificus TaxID=54126 RepID=A0A2A6B6D8_PRIPA|nr:hypothetical protein PRIPAC_88459 [Pristionchus pacificus]|eukprot:PDM61428.1 hypothetical protein PRIPAC_50870 [Pristionchus pacificus]